MGRIIKFRVYNQRDKKMHYDITGFEFFGDGNMSGVFIDGTFFLIEEIELMQYTGLKDKNGKEIYEGDIVKVHYIGGDGTENNKVIFYRGTFCLDYSKDYKPLLNELNHYCEIIGNIYENENLLDKAGD